MNALPMEQPVALEDTRAVEAFLLREARLLDNECWDEWLQSLSETIHYWMPGIENRRREDKSGPYRLEHMAFFDDGMRDLQRRVARFKQPSAWAENPPTRNVHLISNIEVFAGEQEGEFIAFSCFMNIRSRGLDESHQLVGRREDVLRREADGLKLLKRKILIPNAMLLCKNINTFL
ncbi:3-phenylpropionate/cinnamic acid dioxygenase subunit beta [Pseudomonas sp. P5_152]|uniref:3-phenylpropionate/cinnamic acid dioxygenase subunit beta n=1 Tax=Pseudomonas sp. P5_152 TaxID=3043442 RepID=UPI002A365D9D|nr:3-phenylpropionate/cinnamic acid dioxygenase subunit beta [Pseudomonas sp. P5_152]MDX9668090.1 3-phenylpropionate/cinnamic acid dioxygenase subunit beta [Pseudomonas sp. P5_152]